MLANLPNEFGWKIEILLQVALFCFLCQKKFDRNVTDFWTVVFVLFRYKSSRVKLEEYEISSRTQLTFEERESERKLDKEKEEEIEEYIWNITRNKSLHVSAASAEHSLSFGRVQPLSKNVPWFCRFCKRHLTAIDQPATTFTEMAYTK